MLSRTKKEPLFIISFPLLFSKYKLVTLPCEDAPSIIEAVIYSKSRAITKEMQWVLEHLRSTQYDESFHLQEAFQPDTIL